MNDNQSIFHHVVSGLAQLAFPRVCLCCGTEVLKNQKHICSFCLAKRFEDANPENKESSSGVIMPEKVMVQHALWQFDKGGLLQNLMHHLKYERLTDIGLQLGKVLGRRARKHPVSRSLMGRMEARLLPVPLHYLKFRKRGFNQAFHIARGIEDVLDAPICSIDAVVRRRFTQSQTGFTLEKRIQNMENAFKVPKPKQVQDKLIIIVDDVFTTGATTFELAHTLTEAGTSAILIWTLAQA